MNYGSFFGHHILVAFFKGGQTDRFYGKKINEICQQITRSHSNQTQNQLSMQNQPTCLNEMMNGWTKLNAWCIKNPHKIMQVNGTMPGLKLQQHFCTTVQPTETPSGGIRSHKDYTQTNTGEKSFSFMERVQAHTHTRTHTHTCTHTHIHAHPHTHTHTHTQLSLIHI